MYAWIYIHVHVRMHEYIYMYMFVYIYMIYMSTSIRLTAYMWHESMYVIHVTWLTSWTKKKRSTSIRKQWTAEEEEKFLKALDKIGPKDTELDPRTGRVCAHLFWRASFMCDVTHEIGLRDSELDPRTGLVCDLTRVCVTWHIYMWTHTHILNHIFVCKYIYILTCMYTTTHALTHMCVFVCEYTCTHATCVCVDSCVLSMSFSRCWMTIFFFIIMISR